MRHSSLPRPSQPFVTAAVGVSLVAGRPPNAKSTQLGPDAGGGDGSGAAAVAAAFPGSEKRPPFFAAGCAWRRRGAREKRGERHHAHQACARATLDKVGPGAAPRRPRGQKCPARRCSRRPVRRPRTRSARRAAEPDYPHSSRVFIARTFAAGAAAFPFFGPRWIIDTVERALRADTAGANAEALASTRIRAKARIVFKVGEDMSLDHRSRSTRAKAVSGSSGRLCLSRIWAHGISLVHAQLA